MERNRKPHPAIHRIRLAALRDTSFFVFCFFFLAAPKFRPVASVKI